MVYGHISTPHTHTPALQSFRDHHERDPLGQSRSTDSEELLRLREGVATRFNISKELIPEELTKYDIVCVCVRRKVQPLFPVIHTHTHPRRCYSELSPVCAVVGGVLAQEIIKVEQLHCDLARAHGHLQ